MIVDANLLLYAVDASSPHHERVRIWWEEQLNGDARVGIPWHSLLAFLRIATHPRALRRPLPSGDAWARVQDWLDQDVVWTPVPTDRHAGIMARFVERYRVAGNLVPDAHLAALAHEYGVPVASADTDFARFEEVRWVNPIAGEVGS